MYTFTNWFRKSKSKDCRNSTTNKVEVILHLLTSDEHQ